MSEPIFISPRTPRLRVKPASSEIPMTKYDFILSNFMDTPELPR